MNSHANKALGALQHENESQAKDQEAYEGRVVGLGREVDESVQQTLKWVYGAFDQVEALRPPVYPSLTT